MLCVSKFDLYDWVLVMVFEAFPEETVGYRLSRKSRSAKRPRGYALGSFLREWRVAVMVGEQKKNEWNEVSVRNQRGYYALTTLAYTDHRREQTGLCHPNNQQLVSM